MGVFSPGAKNLAYTDEMGLSSAVLSSALKVTEADCALLIRGSKVAATTMRALFNFLITSDLLLR
jgi:hypothetical protein